MEKVCLEFRVEESGSDLWMRRTRLADSSFTVAGPAAWNSLPVHIRNIQSHSAFCRHLKTYLFAD